MMSRSLFVILFIFLSLFAFSKGKVSFSKEYPDICIDKEGIVICRYCENVNLNGQENLEVELTLSHDKSNSWLEVTSNKVEMIPKRMVMLDETRYSCVKLGGIYEFDIDLSKVTLQKDSFDGVVDVSVDVKNDSNIPPQGLSFSEQLEDVCNYGINYCYFGRIFNSDLTLNVKVYIYSTNIGNEQMKIEVGNDNKVIAPSIIYGSEHVEKFFFETKGFATQYLYVFCIEYSNVTYKKGVFHGNISISLLYLKEQLFKGKIESKSWHKALESEIINIQSYSRSSTYEERLYRSLTKVFVFTCVLVIKCIFYCRRKSNREDPCLIPKELKYEEEVVEHE